MESCLGGSKRNIKAKQELQKQQQQQQQLQEFYIHQQQRHHQQQQKYYQQQQEQHLLKTSCRQVPTQRGIDQQQQQQQQQNIRQQQRQLTAKPKFVNNCLQFPPPPTYPPPHNNNNQQTTMAHRNNNNLHQNQQKHIIQHHHHQQQQQQQQQLNLQLHGPTAMNALQQQFSHMHMDSRSPSSSSSSATSATTIGISPCGRRHVLPRYPDPDPDAIEICNVEEPVKMARNMQRHITNTLPLETAWTTHDYSYAYYEPGVAMRHSNIPPPELAAAAAAAEAQCLQTTTITKTTTTSSSPPPPPPNSIRALLSKGKKNKLLVSPATRQSYQTRYGMGRQECTELSLCENFYEEISSNDVARNQLRATATSHSAGSLSQSLVEEELRRVQHRHRKILGELNLSVEAMLMPESPPASSPLESNGSSSNSSRTRDKPSVSVTTSSGQPLRLSATSTDNICESSQLAEESVRGGASCTQTTGFCAADLDSGFSGSSGASYIGSLRLHKTNAALSQLKHARQMGDTSFNYGTQSCRSFQRNHTIAGHQHQHQHQLHHHQQQQQQLQQLHHQQQQQQQQQQIMLEQHEAGATGFLTRASCGRRVLNCAKIRAAEDPGPVPAPTESKARSFWNRKGWRKLPGFSTSTSSINDTGLTGE